MHSINTEGYISLNNDNEKNIQFKIYYKIE
jgi:hypothetical protein